MIEMQRIFTQVCKTPSMERAWRRAAVAAGVKKEASDMLGVVSDGEPEVDSAHVGRKRQRCNGAGDEGRMESCKRWGDGSGMH